MANIDPELQKCMNTAVFGFAKSLDRMRDEVTKAAIALNELAFELDDKTRIRRRRCLPDNRSGES
jgi:hypothetical protein